jgi:bleomycin hydrolase
MKRRLLLPAALLLSMGAVHAQVDLISKVSGNQSSQARDSFHFTTIVDAETTPVENQANSGTCWSYSTNSFLESEMIKAGKKPVPLAKLYSARCAYIDKAENYVRMHGAVSWGDGGEPHDVVNMYAKYGAMPESIYTGLHYGTTTNQFGELQAVLKSMLDAVVSNKNGTLTPVWKDAFTKVTDTYLGEVPGSFEWEGKTYTPQTFAREVVGLNPDDYVEFMSETNAPYYTKAMLMVPDNWAFQWDWNITPTDVTATIDNALKAGYTVAWGADVSEPYFSWKNGVAFVPAKEFKDLSPKEKAGLFNGPQPELAITPQNRQEAFDNYGTTDDHGMQITGIAKDQNGKEYYIVKNSWGTGNDYKGYLYVTKAYVQYKTTSILVNKKGVPSDLKKKLGI